MSTKNSLNILLGLLKEESRKIKKKKKSSPVSAPIMTRPMGSLFFMDSAVSMMESTEELQKQVSDSKDIHEFIRNIISDYDLRYKNRRAAEHLIKIEPIDFIDSIKPNQKIHKEVLETWIDIIKDGKRPFVIVRTNNEIDGHHKLEAYRTLGFDKVPVVFEKDLIEFYNKNKLKNLNESAIKAITKKFDNLKWPLNDFQKQFLDDFINIPEETLKEDDFKYASNRTGIPVASIKSIRNTYSEKLTPEQEQKEYMRVKKELGLAGGEALNQEALDRANEEFTKVRDLPKIGGGRQVPMNQNPGFRSMTPSETIYKMKNGVDGGLQKTIERKIPDFIYEWLMYFLEGASSVKIKDSKVMSEIHSTTEKNHKYVLFSFENTEKLSGAHPYDVASNKKISSLKEFEEKLSEFNETFNTNFIISNQYIGEDNDLKVVLENAQLIKDGEVAPRDMFDFSDTDREKAMRFGIFDQDGLGDISTYRSITE